MYQVTPFIDCLDSTGPVDEKNGRGGILMVEELGLIFTTFPFLQVNF